MSKPKLIAVSLTRPELEQVKLYVKWARQEGCYTGDKNLFYDRAERIWKALHAIPADAAGKGEGSHHG